MDQATLRQLLVTKTSEWSAETDQLKKDAILTEVTTLKNALSVVVKEDERVKAETNPFGRHSALILTPINVKRAN